MKKQAEERKAAIAQSVPFDVNNIFSSLATLNIDAATAEITEFNYQVALEGLSKQEQQEVKELAEKIDVKRVENIMEYGSIPLQRTFKQCGDFLREESGSNADRKIIEQVAELSKKASQKYADFNLALKEPSKVKKAFSKVWNSKSQVEKIQNCAESNYQLLIELKKSRDMWLEMLKRAMSNISLSLLNDREAVELLEMYIIAGRVAQERISTQIQLLSNSYANTGPLKYQLDLNELETGYKLLEVRLENLEKQRTAYYLSIGQLQIIERSNINVQIAIRTQIDNSLTLMAQQLRNSVLNSMVNEAIEGRKNFTQLNETLMRNLAREIGLTAIEAERLITEGCFDVDIARDAVKTVIESSIKIQTIAEEALPKLKAETTQIVELIDQLEPYIDSMKTLEYLPSEIEGLEDLKF